MTQPTAGDKEPVTLTSADPTAGRAAQLRALFPDCVAEGRIDFDKLRAALGDAVAGGPERFSFSWAGRADAASVLQTPSRATLVPKPGESVNWDATRNLFIEGDNLEVLKLLYKAYAGKVKLIYIDPPYNTGQDFVYPDDFADPLGVYLKLTGQADEQGKLLTSNPETSGRYARSGVPGRLRYHGADPPVRRTKSTGSCRSRCWNLSTTTLARLAGGE